MRQTFDQFHNTEKKMHERNLMLKGEWPTDSCQYCRKIEENNGFSDRQLHLTIPDQYPKELDVDPTEVTVTPRILEVYFNYTCNLACLYCIPTLSSKINQENKKFGVFEKNGVTLESVEIQSDHSQLIEKFWGWMDGNSANLTRFNVLGGEPFYQSEFYNCLEYFNNTSHPDLEFCIVTNLMVSPDKLQESVAKFKSMLAKKKIRRVDITCSIDCWGPEQEYVRHGIDLDLWVKNFEYLLSQKWITLNINQTISTLTIKTMPELLEKLAKWRETRPVGHFFSVVAPQPTYMAPAIVGPGVFNNDFAKIIARMPAHTEQDLTAIKYMQGIATEIENSNVSTSELLKLRTFLDEKDRRRGTSWRTTFPWLTQVFEQ
jgi:pyruvate-formate lyase-activating enzyme